MSLPLMHPHHVNTIHDLLHSHGESRTLVQIDNAIQFAIESVTDEDGYRPNLDNTQTWWRLEPLILESLDLDPDHFLDTSLAA